MTTDATRLRQYRNLAEVDMDALIRSAHFERNRQMVAQTSAVLRTMRRSVLHRLQIVPRVLPAE